ncbi:MAG: hypothetical protein U9P88_00420 [Patescibacteria group bacterium]|nr:hypothetical protein [Patescibacteria group bacterium]
MKLFSEILAVLFTGFLLFFLLITFVFPLSIEKSQNLALSKKLTISWNKTLSYSQKIIDIAWPKNREYPLKAKAFIMDDFKEKKSVIEKAFKSEKENNKIKNKILEIKQTLWEKIKRPIEDIGGNN